MFGIFCTALLKNKEWHALEAMHLPGIKDEATWSNSKGRQKKQKKKQHTPLSKRYSFLKMVPFQGKTFVIFFGGGYVQG